MERSKENTGLEVGVRARTGAGHSRTGPAAGDEEEEEEEVVVVEMDEGLEPVVEVELGTRTGMPHGATSWTGRVRWTVWAYIPGANDNCPRRGALWRPGPADVKLAVSWT